MPSQPVRSGEKKNNTERDRQCDKQTYSERQTERQTDWQWATQRESGSMVTCMASAELGPVGCRWSTSSPVMIFTLSEILADVCSSRSCIQPLKQANRHVPPPPTTQRHVVLHSHTLCNEKATAVMMSTVLPFQLLIYNTWMWVLWCRLMRTC